MVCQVPTSPYASQLCEVNARKPGRTRTCNSKAIVLGCSRMLGGISREVMFVLHCIAVIHTFFADKPGGSGIQEKTI